MAPAGERELIERFFAGLTRRRDDVVLGIGDDAALLRPPPARELAVSTDTLVAGVHFDAGADAADVGYKSLAVNLSDLAAMGAEPLWLTLSLTMPVRDDGWLGKFAGGLGALADRFDVGLVGGDLSRGPLSITVQIIGAVPPGAALRRDGARAGDDVYVTGQLGCAAFALQPAAAAAAARHDCRRRLLRPEPRVEAGRALRGLAHACIDISDGLITDLGHVLRASGTGACIELDQLPACAALRSVADVELRQRLLLAGGDDYELCFTAATAAAGAVRAVFCDLDLTLTRVGTIVGDAGSGLHLRHAEGGEFRPGYGGYQHF